MGAVGVRALVTTACVGLLHLAACGGDPDPPAPDPDAGGSGDAGADAAVAADAAVGPPELPEPPAPPVLTPCPPGWSETAPDLGVVTCEPWPARTDVRCPPGEAWFPGGSGCERHGAECPEDGWPADLPAEGVTYVSAGAVAGLGSRAQPFGTISEAVEAAGNGEIVAIGVGTYDEVVMVGSSLSLRGACVTGTRWTSSIVSRSGALVVTRGAVDVRDVGFVDLGGPAVEVSGVGASVGLQDVAVDRARHSALVAGFGGHLEATRVAVRDTTMSELGFATAIDVELGSTASVRSVVALDGGGGIFVSGDGSTLTAEDLAIVGCHVDEALKARGVAVQDGAVLTLRRALIEDAEGEGLHAGGAGARGTLEDIVIRDTHPWSEDAVPDFEEGRGLEVILGAAVEVRRGVFERNRELGIGATHAGSTLGLQDVVVRDTDSEPVRGTDGSGILVQDGAEARLYRVLVARNRQAGVDTFRAGVLHLDDVLVADTAGRARDEGWGAGIWLAGSPADGRRIRLERNHNAGLQVDYGPARVALEELSVLDTEGRFDGRGGNGIYAAFDVELDLRGLELEGNREVALYATNGARVDAHDVTIRQTRRRACAADTCADTPGGHGVGAYGRATVALQVFELADAELCGLQIAGDAEVDLHGGTVEDNGIGGCVQVPGYDLRRLQDQVVFGPGQFLELTDLPLPEPMPDLD